MARQTSLNAGFAFVVVLSLSDCIWRSPLVFDVQFPSKDPLNGTVDRQFAKPSHRRMGRRC